MLDYQFFENNQESKVEEWYTDPFEDGLSVKGCRCSGETAFVRIPETIDGKQVLAVSFASDGTYGSGFPSGADILIPRSAYHIVSAWYNEKWKEHVCIHPDNPHFVIKYGLLLSGDMTKVHMRCDCSAIELKIPDEVVEICSGAFALAENVESIHLGKNVQQIGAGAFPNTRAGDARSHGSTTSFSRPIVLKAITVSEENEVFSSKDGFLYSKDGRRLIKAPEIIPDGIYTVPEGTVCLATGSFAKNQNIQKIVAHHPLDTIEKKAFADCFKLHTVQIDKIGTIESEAFYECFGLKDVSIGMVGAIGYASFNRCHKLENVCIGSVDSINSAFGDSGLKYFRIPRNAQKVSAGTFMWCEDINIEMYDILHVNPGELAYRYEYSGSGGGWTCYRHWITVKSAEDDQILYRVYMGTRAGTHSKYREAVVKGWVNYPSFDFESLDAAFSSLKDMEEKTEVAKLRLMYPVSLADGAKKQYEDFMRRNGKKIVAKCLEKNDAETLQILADGNLLKQDIITAAIDMCNGESQPEIMAILLSLRANSTGDIEETLKIPSATELLKKNWSTKKLPDGTLEITSYKGEDEYVVVPSQIGKNRVTQIAARAMDYNSANKDKKEKLDKIRSITVSDGIVDIGEYAFSGCKNCTEILLPESVKTIAGTAFSYCPGLQDEHGIAIVRDVFCGYYGSAAEVAIPKHVTQIGLAAFDSCENLKQVTIPSGVRTIVRGAFAKCKAIRKVFISGSSTEIAPNAFDDCRKLTIYAPAGSHAESFAKGNPKKFNFVEEAQLPEKPDACTAKEQNVSITELKRGPVVKRSKHLEDTWNVFQSKTESQIKKEWTTETNADGLTIMKYKGEDSSFVIPRTIGGKKVVCLAADSFRASCSFGSGKKSAYNKKMYKTKAVIIQEGIVQIGAAAFAGCVFMTDICLPGSLTEIGADAFRDCHKLSIHAPEGSYAETYAKENNIPFVAE